MIAALFVDNNGVYNIDGVDVWGSERDAKQYKGDYPVVAHPPCQLWGKMAKINYIRWGGEHNKPGNDGGCFELALRFVNQWGGVLEHPASSYAWPEYGLTKPVKSGWIPSGAGWVCEVWQSAYGHKANKKTWLYYKGVRKPFPMNWNTPKGFYQIGFQDQRGKLRNKPTISGKEASATPLLFRDELLKLAKWSYE